MKGAPAKPRESLRHRPLDNGTEVRFGSYGLDVRSGRLSSETRSTILPEKSLRILLALLERPSVLVTRGELWTRLWGNETFVDFDDGLNHAVRHLREVLEDQADHPRFIETIPGRGYRFIGKVDTRRLAGSRQWPAAGSLFFGQLERRLDEVCRQLADVRRQLQGLLPSRGCKRLPASSESRIKVEDLRGLSEHLRGRVVGEDGARSSRCSTTGGLPTAGAARSTSATRS